MFDSLFHRHEQPRADWQKIPWNDPDFSQRMLNEHLSQMHDLASRRLETIDVHVAWIQQKALEDQPARILDLGCGPGFYVDRLTALGHTCIGMDFSPASIAYARQTVLHGQFLEGDIRTLDYGEDFDLVMMIYGELNAFSPTDAALIVDKAWTALKPGGRLLLEVSRYESVYEIGQEGPSWHTAESGLFADEPYLCLTESRFEEGRAISDYYIYLISSGAMQQYTSMHHAYTEDEYRHLLRAFSAVQRYPSLTGNLQEADMGVFIAEK